MQEPYIFIFSINMTTEVLIVGGGPSGLTLGLFLADHGIKVCFFDLQDGPWDSPRCIYDLIRWSLVGRAREGAEY